MSIVVLIFLRYTIYSNFQFQETNCVLVNSREYLVRRTDIQYHIECRVDKKVWKVIHISCNARFAEPRLPLYEKL